MLLLWAMASGTHDAYADAHSSSYSHHHANYHNKPVPRQAKGKKHASRTKHITIDDSLEYMQCMKRITKHYDIPLGVFYGMAKTEAGWIGLYRPNKRKRDGTRTYDMGLMQINSAWLKILGNKFHLSAKSIADNGCLNILIAAKIYDYERKMIQRKHPRRKVSVWDVVGNYHSKSRSLQAKYVKKVVNNMMRHGA